MNENSALSGLRSATDMTRLYGRHRDKVKVPRRRAGKVFAGIGVLMLVFTLAAAGAWWWTTPRPVAAYEVQVGTRTIGMVTDKEAFSESMEAYRQRMNQELTLDVEFAQQIEYRPVETLPMYIPEMDVVLDSLKGVLDVQTDAVAIYIDDKLAAATKNEEDATWVVNQVLEPLREYVIKGDIVDVGYVEKVEVARGKVPASIVKSKEETFHDLLIGTEEKREYTVEKGDSIRSIASKFNMTVSDLKKANLKLVMDDTLYPGDKVNLVVPNNVLNVCFNKVVQTKAELPYETEVEKDSSLYTSQEKVVQEGKKGEREVIAEQQYVNGVLVDEKIVSEEITKKAVKRVVAKGTRKVEATSVSASKSDSGSKNPETDESSSGIDEETLAGSKSSRYIWPTKGRVSSGFGRRWGRLHAGLDIANSKGTPIYAARAGTVTFSGYNSGGYGKMIKINCGNGVENRYAHCSKLVVGSGKKVKRGQLIAYMGSTGNSTGPHLHFEVRVNGVAKNPRKYLP